MSDGKRATTHCQRGHLRTAKNTRVYDISQHCLDCAKDRRRAKAEKRELDRAVAEHASKVAADQAQVAAETQKARRAAKATTPTVAAA
ncbi:MAG TPA: hypothetical protein VMT61_08880 [Candidatus Binataceae bacterium]|nr:hypothetical protein [Candidatus Binataceae bacterium]